MTVSMRKFFVFTTLAVLTACAKSKDAAPPPPASSAPSAPASAAPAPAAAAPAEAAGDQELTLDQATDGLPKDGKLMVELVTDLGSVHCQLLPEAAPKTVASFVGLARGLRPFQDPESGKWVKRPLFDGLAFHRVIPGFMIQGGDPLSAKYDDPRIGMGGPGYTLPDEIAPDLKFDHPGLLAMANTGPHTHSGGSQFFITEKPYPSLNGGYVIFGQCEDANVVSAIAHVQRGANDKPVTPVTMKVKIYRK
jgi:peptidyl-prolyl cis-trans isomerase A (cyclophilin A)